MDKTTERVTNVLQIAMADGVRALCLFHDNDGRIVKVFAGDTPLALKRDVLANAVNLFTPKSEPQEVI